MQNAICWIAEHYDEVSKMAEGKEMPKEEREAFLRKAIEEKKDLSIMLLYFQQIVDERRHENQSNEE